jgi:ribonuclease HI
MYFDRSLMKTGVGVGLLFISPLGIHMCYMIRLHFAASNNIAEYEALVNGLRIAIELGVRHLDVRGDSQLVIDLVMKDSSCHDPKMEVYCKEVRCLEDKFYGLELNHITRRYNEAANELTKIVSNRTMVLPDVFSRDLHEPSIDIRATGGSTVYHSTPYLRQRPPRSGQTSCRRKARLYQLNSSSTSVSRTSTVSFEGRSHRIRPRLDGSLAGSKPL